MKDLKKNRKKEKKMIQNRYEYWFKQSFLNSKQIKDINKYIKKNFDGNEQSVKANYKDVKKLTTKTIAWRKMKDYLNEVVEYYSYINQDVFGYDVFPLNNWAHVNYNSYKGKDSEYGWHCDATTQGENCDIKLTILINLSEKKYEGGDLKIFTGEEFMIPEFKNPGDTVMIKSPTYHKVTPITKGERITLAIFLRGPKFR